MGEKERELYGLAENPSNSLVIVFEVEVAVEDGFAAGDGFVVVVGVWVQ